MKEKPGKLLNAFNFAFFILGKRQLNFSIESNWKRPNVITNVITHAYLLILFEMVYFYKGDFFLRILGKM